MGSFIIVLTVFAVYCSEVYCDTLPTEVAKPEDPALLEKSNNSHATIERESFWKTLNSLSKRRSTRLEESRNFESANGVANTRKGRFLNSLAFLTGLSFGGLATAASSTMKSIAKMPQMFGINLGSSKTSPYFAAYYSQYPYSPLLPYPLFYPGPFGITPMIDAAKPQTSQNDLAPQVINLFEHRPIDLAGNNEEDYDTEEEKSNRGNGADNRVRAVADRNAEEKGTIHGCKEGQQKSSKGTTREREHLQQTSDVDLRAAMNFRAGNQSIIGNIIDSILGGGNTTTTTPLNNDTDTTQRPTQHPQHHHHHHHHHHGDYTDYPPFQGYYGGYPQNVHHVDLTTTQPHTQISYNVPYEHPNYYHGDKYNPHPGLNPSYSPPISPGLNEHQVTDFNRLYSEFQPPSNNDGFKPLK